MKVGRGRGAKGVQKATEGGVLDEALRRSTRGFTEASGEASVTLWRVEEGLGDRKHEVSGSMLRGLTENQNPKIKH